MEEKGFKVQSDAEEDVRCDYLEFLKCTPRQQADAHSSTTCLRRHHSAEEIVRAGFNSEQLCQDLHGITAKMLKEAEYKARNLVLGGCRATHLKGAYSKKEMLEDQRYPVNALNLEDFTMKDMKDAGYTPEQLNTHFSPKNLKAAGFDEYELFKAHVDLKRAGFPLKKLYDDGWKIEKVKRAGFSDDDVKKHWSWWARNVR